MNAGRWLLMGAALLAGVEDGELGSTTSAGDTMSQTTFPENTYLHIVFTHVAGDRDYLHINGSEGVGARLAAGDRAAVTAVFTWNGFVGVLDEFAVYDKALATPRIAAHRVAQAK